MECSQVKALRARCANSPGGFFSHIIHQLPGRRYARRLSAGEIPKLRLTEEGKGYVVRRLLNINEAAQYLGLAPKTLRNRLGPRAQKPFPIKPKRIGKRVLFDIKALDAFIDRLDVSG